jgi:hypothetical protein
MVEARGNAETPFRFIYMSGAAAERDQSKKPSFMPQYSLMRVSLNDLPRLLSLGVHNISGVQLMTYREKRKAMS